MQITVSTPGKLMLMGEHAVVYGYPCIVSAVDRYLTVTIEFSGKKKDTLATEGCFDRSFVSETIKFFRREFGVKEKICFESKSEISGYGLGSSAAVVVATFKALLQLYQISIGKRELFNLCKKVVLDVQEIGSGFDAASIIFGGTIYYTMKGEVIESLETPDMPIIVAYSGEKADTISQINLVEEKLKSYRRGVEVIFENIAKLVMEARNVIFEKDWQRLGKLFNYNQDYLENLGVSTEKLNTMITASRKEGAFGAKLSGAGGGDCMIALVSSENKKSVIKAIEKVGGEVISLKIEGSRNKFAG